jgi:hypothetical protein
MSINTVIGILSSPVPSTASSSPIPFSPSSIPSSPPVSSISSTYLSILLPDDVLLIIASFTGSAITKLKCTSKSICKNITYMTEYLMSTNYKKIVEPHNTTDLTSAIIRLNPSYYKNWGASRSTTFKEFMFTKALENEPISTVKEIMSIGVDINCAIVQLGVTQTVRKPRIFPIHSAIYSNDPEKILLLFNHGATIPRKVTYYFNDLLSYTSDTKLQPTEVNKKIPGIIINEHIKQRDFCPFFKREWRSDIRVFKWFCDALSSLPRGLETGSSSYCDNVSCCKWRDNLRICNGLFLCGECTTSSEGPGKEPLNEGNYIDKLWIEPYSDMYYEYYGGDEDHENEDEDHDHDDYEDEDEAYHANHPHQLVWHHYHHIL